MSERLLIATTALALLALAEAAEAPAYAAEDPSDRVRSPTAKSLQVVQADAQPAPLVPPVPQPARRPARTAAPGPQLAPLIPPVPQPAIRPLRLAALPEQRLAPLLVPPVPQLARRPLKRDSKSIHLLACLKPAARELLDRIEGEFGPMEIISTCRPGARIAGSGRISKHARGEAIDFEAGSRKGDVVRWLIANHKTGGTMTYSDMSHVHVDVGQHFVALNAYSGR
jgi:hypothetical protein